MRFLPWAPPRTPLGELATFPQDPIAGLKGLVLGEGEVELASKGIEGEERKEGRGMILFQQ